MNWFTVHTSTYSGLPHVCQYSTSFLLIQLSLWVVKSTQSLFTLEIRWAQQLLTVGSTACELVSYYVLFCTAYKHSHSSLTLTILWALCSCTRLVLKVKCVCEWAHIRCWNSIYPFTCVWHKKTLQVECLIFAFISLSFITSLSSMSHI